MRSSILITSLFAALAVASPVHQALQKKAIVYDVVTDIVTVTVTAGNLPQVVKVQKTVYVNPVAATTTKPKRKSSKTRRPRPTTSSKAPPPPPPAPTTTTTTPPPPPPTTTQPPPPPPSPKPVVVEPAPKVVAPKPVYTAPAAAPPSSSSGNKVRDTAINDHNEKRAAHGAGTVSWDDALAADADKLAQKCVFDHEIYGSYGQNIASRGSSEPNAYQPEDVMHNSFLDWYNEVEDFRALGYAGKSDVPMNTPKQLLHFTQVVWKATTKIGCAVNYCGTNLANSMFGYMVVCNYQVAGNMGGAFAQNVSA